MTIRLSYVTALLFGSGLCALIYQVAWMKQLALIFGASTAASAAVLAIFMGGLGLGGVLIGKRADRHQRPLVLYAQLEMSIALAAAVSPFLIMGARALYISLGGSVVLGLTGATLVRLLLSAIIIGIPAVLMGGTLPAAARAAETEDDIGRNRIAVLYGINTLGAVTGALLSTFVLLESQGIKLTLWLACLINSAVALIAWWLGDKAAP
ncbi:MAG: spermidine synthase, partial [candidate division Zixibacteria bacterium]|nr:spermidine synthase [candidate division Zixibacteria bacterium]